MDIKIKKIVDEELNRQRNNIELIASENFVSKDVMALQGSVLTNKYAEGYSGKRYYGGCEFIDQIEDLAISYVTKLFDCKYANVQPHSGSQANMAVYKALLNIGDTVMGLDLDQGGHLTHGYKINFSGKEYHIVSYGLDPKTELIDYDAVERIAKEVKPKMIIAGASAYSRTIDFKRFRDIADECGAYLMVDMAHIAGLVATGLHPSPLPYADVVTSTTHKTLRGPRGGIILTNNEDIIKKINKTIFPGIQGGPLMHVIAAKAECFYEALQPSFKTYQENVLKNISAMADNFMSNGYHIVSNGTDNHLILLDVKSKLGMTGKDAEDKLGEINITVNKNTIPNDTEKATLASGIRIGSPAMTSRGLNEQDFIKISDIIMNCLEDKKPINELKKEVKDIVSKYPLYE